MTREAYDHVMHAPHKAKLSHEIIAAAAAYQAMKSWNEHKMRHGETVDHARAKEFMAAAAGAFIDHMIETKGLDAIDRHRAREHAHGHFIVEDHGHHDHHGHHLFHHHHHRH